MWYLLVIQADMKMKILLVKSRRYTCVTMQAFWSVSVIIYANLYQGLVPCNTCYSTVTLVHLFIHVRCGKVGHFLLLMGNLLAWIFFWLCKEPFSYHGAKFSSGWSLHPRKRRHVFYSKKVWRESGMSYRCLPSSVNPYPTSPSPSPLHELIR